MHHEQDLKTLDLMVQLIRQLEKDHQNGVTTDTEPMMNYVSSYVAEKRQEMQTPIRCDGFADLPFPPALSSVVDERSPKRIKVFVGQEELNFCSLWCMVGHFVRTEGMRLTPGEELIDLKN